MVGLLADAPEQMLQFLLRLRTGAVDDRAQRWRLVGLVAVTELRVQRIEDQLRDDQFAVRADHQALVERTDEMDQVFENLAIDILKD